MNATKHEKIMNQDTPLSEVLGDLKFVEVTDLREYILGFIPTRKKVGADLLATQLSCWAIIGKPVMIQDCPNVSHESTDHMYMVVVTQDGRVWVGRQCTELHMIDHRLHTFTDRSDDPAFARIVRLHRLRACDLLASIAGETLNQRD